METIFVNTDGGARGNPGPAAIGVVVVDGGGAVVLSHGATIGEATNNVAEYRAVIEALKQLCQHYGADTATTHFIFRLDSELVVKQLNGEYKVKDATLGELHTEIKTTLASAFPHLSFTHVRREQNREADQLVNKALDGG
jgi:ribonuclease HI